MIIARNELVSEEFDRVNKCEINLSFKRIL